MSNEIPGVFYDDPKMSSEDLDKIVIFSENECKNNWTEYVSEISGHFMQMANDEWPSIIVDGNNCWYRWVDDWNDDDYSQFSAKLRCLNIPGKSVLYIFWMKEVGLKTTWEVFCKNWGNFLYEDEGCILVLPDFTDALVLSNGSAWFGKRGTPKTSHIGTHNV
ncbi:MAG: DUF2947 family protein [Candidatus Thiodiazotropha sp.]